MALTLEERQEFLAQPHIAALSVAEGTDRAPLTLPIWYQYKPGSEPWVLTGPDSRKMRLINETGRFSLMVHRTVPTIRYVTVEGPVTRIEPMTKELHLEMVTRYLSGDSVAAYLKEAESFGPQVAVYLKPEHWVSADLGAV
ncbi:pyridoxamine 5'-phosphate oxidase family protein [Nocardia altamirensis]|uniref:pyridoxamine 5'-phosphate oxidase family protein n=1 Tax=Nocardia altamirensis TaxID=472158 RepID=UPI0008407050|nr:pyridoxamine 5'-phosphate oxidase family protein [Nocardia altamirensis]